MNPIKYLKCLKIASSRTKIVSLKGRSANPQSLNHFQIKNGMGKAVWNVEQEPQHNSRPSNIRDLSKILVLYSLGHVFSAMVVVFCIIAIPLYEPTSNFSLHNLTWCSFHFGLASAAIFIQIAWFTKICLVRIETSFLVLLVVDVLVYCAVVFGQMANHQFPIPFLLNFSGAVVWLLVNIPILYFIGKRKQIEDYHRLFKKFVVFCAVGVSFFITRYEPLRCFSNHYGSLGYLFAFSKATVPLTQVLIQILYNIASILAKEVLFTMSDGNNTSIYYVEFSANFFSLMALPSITTPLTFAFNLFTGLINLGYQVIILNKKKLRFQFCRLSPWWFSTVEERILARFRKFFLGSCVKEALSHLRRETLVAPFHSTVIHYACIDDYFDNVVRTLYFTALAKIFAPLGFIVYFGFLKYSQNSRMYPWKPATSFELIIQFSFFTFLVNSTLSICVMYLVWKRWKLSPADAIRHAQKNFVICFACVLGAFIVPFTVLEKHYHTVLWK
jgi:hypothetical protein